MIRAAALSLTLLSTPLAATAQAALQSPAETLFDALNLPEILEIMQEEGLSYADQIQADLFPGQGTEDWPDKVAAIYDIDRMRSEVITALQTELEGVDIAPMIDFFGTEPGLTIISLEASGRGALLDEDVEAAANEAAAMAMADETERYRMIRDFVEANDLIDTNVTGAMNSNYAFFMGLVEGGAFPFQMTEDQMLRDVWAQEPEIRRNTTEWVYSFLLMAYQPLSDEDLQAYIDFSLTEAGQQMNRALFAAFDDMFDRVSYSLGAGAAVFMAGEET